MSNTKTYLSTTLKQCQTSKLIQVLHSNNVKHQTYLSTTPNNVKHQNLSKYYTQTMSNIKPLSKYLLKQCQTLKTYPLKQCQTSKLIKQCTQNSNNVKTSKLIPTLKQCQTSNLSKYYTQTMSNIKLIQVLHSNNVKHQNLSKYYTQTMSNIKT
ncbi:unnamed protein product [Mytilus edulis]|uniref:Uncharacterized protein n=1 Tax=Mytilus edulis TaxID=6550 RepID=A0A8S3TNT2_MYTED|nr:unnamed protein product [Mytilus edulis]